ncbi:MAG: hypothetical protein MJ211_09585 [Bacteroidales bacterium]|nr:hypothetical protein [Bacteroidales bacterium]
MSNAKSFNEFINVAVKELLDAEILHNDNFSNGNEFIKYSNKNYSDTYVNNSFTAMNTLDTVTDITYTYKGIIEFRNLLAQTTFCKVKGISPFLKKNNHHNITRLIVLWLRDNTIVYSFTSWQLPINYTLNIWIRKRTQEECDLIADAWDCSYHNVTTSDYRPWPICYNMNYLPESERVDVYPGTKMFSDIKDLKTSFDEEKSELFRCIPIAIKMTKEYNESVKKSREMMKEANRLKREAVIKAQEAKNIVLNAKAKINNVYTRKELLKKDF